MSTQPAPDLTLDQYLEIERAADTRSEFLNGQMYALAGASGNHGRIVPAAMTSLSSQLRGSECEAASSDLRLSVGQHGLVTYPDIFVTCGPD